MRGGDGGSEGVKGFISKLGISLGSRVWAETIRTGDSGAIADWFTTYFFFTGIALLVVFDFAAAYEGGRLLAFRVAGFGILLAGASTVMGWVFGLLFGIPRSLARPQSTIVSSAPGATGVSQPQNSQNVPNSRSPGQNASATGGLAANSSVQGEPRKANQATSRVNTNLEDISDWLTKTIVGVGLTQLYFIPSFMWRVSGMLNAQGILWMGSGQAFVLLTAIYFGFGGFWLGYVGTRTILTRLFDAIDSPADTIGAAAIDPFNIRLSADGTSIAPANTPAREISDRLLLATPLANVRSVSGLVEWAGAHARASNFGLATEALTQALRLRPDDTGIKQQLGTVYIAMNRGQDAGGVLIGTPPNETSLAAALVKSTPEGAAEAISIGEQLLSNPGADKNAQLHVWLARAYGQQLAYATNLPEDARKVIKDRVLREASAAVAADTSTRVVLLGLWKSLPGTPAGELASLPPDDPDLTDLLTPT